MMQCGLLGRKLGHSYSPFIHSLLGDYSYALFEKEPEELETFLKSGEFSGINVTVPYKKDVIPYLDELTPSAQRLCAVNTIVRRGGKLIGHNTDYSGFLAMIKSSGLSVQNKKVLVLGSGGASNTAVAVLEELGAEVVVISRTGNNHYDNLNLHRDASILVNTTPVGMYPHNGASPVDLTQFPVLEGVLDVIYNPARTQLLLDAEKLGLNTVNGLLMLVAQAKEAAEWFLNEPLSDGLVPRIHEQLRRRMENLILVGMPGCGKSTVSQLLSETTGRTPVDADTKIVKAAGKTIPEIFAQDGEETFRNWETQILSDLGKRSGLIIATGGGCVTRERNYPLLHQNGTIIWLQRDIANLPTDGRPLSQIGKLEEMYQMREPKYRAFADYIMDNNGSILETVSNILEVLP